MDSPQPNRTQDDAHTDVVVVGGGVAGLAAAAAAARDGATVTVLAHGRPGGRAAVTHPLPDVVLNSGPRALYVDGPGAAALTELGVSVRGAPPDATSATGSLDGRLHRLPGTPWSLLTSRLLRPGSKARLGALLATIGREDPTALSSRTVEEWYRSRHLAPDARRLVAALVRLATYHDDPELSAEAAVTQLQLVLSTGVLYLDGGFGQIVDALTATAEQHGARVLQERVSAVEPTEAQPGGRPGAARRWAVRSAERTHTAAAVVVAAGSPSVAARLLGTWGDAMPATARPATAACLELVLRRPPRTSVVLGLDAPTYLSVHGPPARLAPDGLVVVHVMRYGARDARRDEDELWDVATAAGIGRDDVVAERFLPRMVVSTAAPLAGTGGLSGRHGIAVADAPGVFVAGDWVGPSGLLADASLSSGVAAGRAAARRTRRSSFEGVRDAGAVYDDRLRSLR